MHARVMAWWTTLEPAEAALAGHALAETYSVLTRLPRDFRVGSEDARDVLGRLGSPLALATETQAGIVERLAAVDHDVPLATRDLRARDTCERLGVRVLLVA